MLVAELGAQAWVYYSNGKWIFEQETQATVAAVSHNSATRQKLSPIFGYSMRPGWRSDSNITNVGALLELIGESKLPDFWSIPANNYGFISKHDYPYHDADPETFYVAVTGGSVANGLALYGEEKILKAIKSVAKFSNRNVVLINLAAGGFKQPQQVQALGYFLSIGQQIDLIINMDGLNEAYIGWDNFNRVGVEYSLPTGVFLYGLLNNFVSRYQTKPQGTYSATAQSTRSALVWLGAIALQQEHESKMAEIESEAGQFSPDRDYPMTIQRAASMSTEELAERIVSTWVRGSIALQGLADRFGAKYIHTIQPNQYHTQKTFGAAEAKLAFEDNNWDGAEIVRKIYPMFIEAGESLKNKGIRFVDLTPVFDKYEEHIYFDVCCHFRGNGYDIIMDDVLAAEIATSLKRVTVPR